MNGTLKEMVLDVPNALGTEFTPCFREESLHSTLWAGLYIVSTRGIHSGSVQGMYLLREEGMDWLGSHRNTSQVGEKGLDAAHWHDLGTAQMWKHSFKRCTQGNEPHVLNHHVHDERHGDRSALEHPWGR
jgi:hypothetical protein